MDEQLSREHKMVMDEVRYWQKKKCPRTDVMDWDENRQHPEKIIKSFKELDLWAMGIDEEYGGTGRDLTGAGLVTQAIAELDPVLAGRYSTDVFTAASEIALTGTDDQKKEWLPRIAEGRIHTARVIPGENEDMTFTGDGDIFTLNGTVSHAAHAGAADLLIVQARSGPDPSSESSAAASFLLPADCGCLSVSPSDTLGYRGAGTAAVDCANVRVPSSAVLGGPVNNKNQSKTDAQIQGLADLAAAFQAAGIARGAMNYALEHARSRVQFNQPVGHFPAISEKLADISVQVRAASLMARSAAGLAQAGKKFEPQAAQALMMASAAARLAGLDGIQITGGYGYTLEYDAQRYMRNAMQLACAMTETSRIRKTITASMGL